MLDINIKQKPMKKILSILISSLALLPLSAFAAAHPEGTNVKNSSGTIYFLDNQWQKRAYTSAGAFLSYGGNSFKNVKSANSDDLALADGPFARWEGCSVTTRLVTARCATRF
jgi:hypothetical protein